MPDRESIRVDVVNTEDLKDYLNIPGYEKFEFLPYEWVNGHGTYYRVTQYLVISYAGRS